MYIDMKALKGFKLNEAYKDGQVKSCLIGEFNPIETSVGVVVPQFTEVFDQFQRRKKARPSITFHSNGCVKSLAMEEQMDIVTPMGIYPAELVTFYEDGSMNRLFPLNGHIDGYWSEEDEGTLAQVFDFDLPIGKLSTKLINIRFDQKGRLKSLTFWPGSKQILKTPLGDIECKDGMALYENGHLKSTEPARAQIVTTPIGKLMAFDPNALGIHGDIGSLQFLEDGSLKSVTTQTNLFEVTDRKGETSLIGPREIDSFVGDDDTELVPVKISFEGDMVHFNNGVKYTYEMSEVTIKIGVSQLAMSGGCSDCSSCSGC